MRTKHRYTQDLFDTKMILDKLELSSDFIVLDAGCGNGYMCKEFNKIIHGKGKVYGIDQNADLIDLINETSKLNDLEVYVSDITQTTIFKEEMFDLVYLSTVFHIFSQDQIKGFIKEILRILKKGGKLVIIEINKEYTAYGPPIDMRVSPKELVEKIPLKPKELINIHQYFYMQIFEK